MILKKEAGALLPEKYGGPVGRVKRHPRHNFEPTLDEMLEDDVMGPVLQSAGMDPQGFRDMLEETARRVDEARATSGADSGDTAD